MNVKLIRVKGGTALRTDSVTGETSTTPAVGERFWLSGEGLEFGTRSVITSPVVELLPNGCFRTESGSVYRLEVLDEP